MLICVGTIEQIIDAFVATIWVFYGLSLLGIIIMRLTEPERRRPFKVLCITGTCCCYSIPVGCHSTCCFLMCVDMAYLPLPHVAGSCVPYCDASAAKCCSSVGSFCWNLNWNANLLHLSNGDTLENSAKDNGQIFK